MLLLLAVSAPLWVCCGPVQLFAVNGLLSGTLLPPGMLGERGGGMRVP